MARDGINWDDDQLEAAGLDRAKVASMVRRFRKLSAEMDAMGLRVYGCDGSGYLTHTSRPEHYDRHDKMIADQGAIIADLGFGFDGGGW